MFIPLRVVANGADSRVLALLLPSTMSSSRPVSAVNLNPQELGNPAQAPPSPGPSTKDALLHDTDAQDTLVPSEVSPADGPSELQDPPPSEPQETIATAAHEDAVAAGTGHHDMPPEFLSFSPVDEMDAQVLATNDANDNLEAPSTSADPGPYPQDPVNNIPLTEADANDAEVPPTSDTSIPTDQHTHLPIGAAFLEPPRASFLTSDPSTPRDSFVPASLYNSTYLLAEKQAGSDVEEPSEPEKRKPSLFKRPWFLLLGLLALVIVAAAVVIPVYFVVIKKNNNSSSAASSGGSGTPTGTAHGSQPTSAGSGPITGGDGSVITTETGDTFTYTNPFGGFCG